MSYSISFKVKVEGVDSYIPVGNCDAKITWNVRDIITQSTGLPWKNEENNGLCKDVIPYIEKGLAELNANGEKYKHLEAENGWGTVPGVIRFFKKILEDWNYFLMWNEELADIATFWIE